MRESVRLPRRATSSGALFLVAILAGCVAGRGELPPTAAAPVRRVPPSLPLPRCEETFAKVSAEGPGADVEPLPPRRLAPRSDSPVELDERIAYVDRESGEVRAIDIDGGRPVVLVPPGPGRADTRLFPGPSPRQPLLFRGGDFFRLSGKGTDAGLVPDEGPIAERQRQEAVFTPLLTANGATAGTSVLPLAAPHALAFVPDDGALAPGLYLADVSARSLLRVFAPPLHHTWAPAQNGGSGSVLLAASDGRYYALDPASPALRCEGPRMPEGFLPGPAGFTADGKLLAFAALRPLPEGGGWAVSLALVDREKRTVQWAGTLPRATALELRAVPGRDAFVVAPRDGTSASLHLLDARGLRRLSPAIEGLGQLAVLSTAVVYTRETPTTELVPTPKPPERRRDPRSGCDPVPPQGGCGWVSNGCDFVFAGPCVRYVREPDPSDGLYAVDFPERY